MLVMTPLLLIHGNILAGLDLLQIRLDTQDKFRIVGMKSDSDIWPGMSRPARETCTLSVLMNELK